MSKIIKIINMRNLRQNQTPAEAKLWQALRRKQVLGYKFRRQHAIGNFILDFYCPALKLGIEVNGAVHNSLEVMRYDKAREELIKNYHVTIIRIQNNEIKDNINQVINRLENYINHLSLSTKGGEG